MNLQGGIVDFLLARIAEDEAEIGMCHEIDCSYGASLNGIYVAPKCNCGRPARVLAECEAKRRIVEEYESLMNVARRARSGDLATSGALLALHGVVKLLALPYADHPDFQEAWRA